MPLIGSWRLIRTNHRRGWIIPTASACQPGRPARRWQPTLPVGGGAGRSQSAVAASPLNLSLRGWGHFSSSREPKSVTRTPPPLQDAPGRHRDREMVTQFTEAAVGRPNQPFSYFIGRCGGGGGDEAAGSRIARVQVQNPSFSCQLDG